MMKSYVIFNTACGGYFKTLYKEFNEVIFSSLNNANRHSSIQSAILTCQAIAFNENNKIDPKDLEIHTLEITEKTPFIFRGKDETVSSNNNS